jgi:hypothetical protein
MTLGDYRKKKENALDELTTPPKPSPFKGEGLGGGEKRKFLYYELRY